MGLSSKSFLMLLTFMLAFNALSARRTLESDDSEAQSPSSDDASFAVLDPNDPKVVGLAKFAIDEYNKETKGSVTFKSVFQAAYTQSDGGLVYGLIVEGSEAAGSSDSNMYDADLKVTTKGSELVAFRERRYD